MRKKRKKREGFEYKIFSFAQAARHAGLTAGGVTRAVQAGRLVATPSGHGIDPFHPQNAAFFKKHANARSQSNDAKRERITAGRASALMAALAARYSLRRERLYQRIGGLVLKELVDTTVGSFLTELSKRAKRIPSMLRGDIGNIERWTGDHISSAIKGAKKAAKAETERFAFGEEDRLLPEIGPDATYDELRAGLNLVDAARDDLHRATLERVLIPREQMQRRFSMIGGEINTHMLSLPRRAAPHLSAIIRIQGITAARRVLAKEIKEALGVIGGKDGIEIAQGNRRRNRAYTTRSTNRRSPAERSGRASRSRERRSGRAAH